MNDAVYESIAHVLCTLAIAVPFVLVAAFGVTALLDIKLSEATIDRILKLGVSIGLAAVLGILGFMLRHNSRHLELDAGHWVDLPGYHFEVKFIYDRLSVPFAILAYALCGTIGAFASRYMHREPGYNRFFSLYTLFLAGMVTASLAGTVETLFLGWELVGLSSATLVAFFQNRPAPPQNGLRIWSIYRISDAALLLAAVVLHHTTGEGDFDALVGKGIWPEGVAGITSQQAFAVGFLLLVAAAGKSALVPFSGWLPRAMEGPTPSSAVFYGALSVHLGAFLLLRIGPLLSESIPLQILTVAIGLATAVYATIVGRVQTDIKSALSFASLGQVGVIVAEIGLGFRYLPLAHIIGHAALRTLQFVRAPSLLRDYHGLENALGGHIGNQPTKGWIDSLLRQPEYYRFALERGYLDNFLDRFIVSPFVRFFRRIDEFERSVSQGVAKPLGSPRQDHLIATTNAPHQKAGR